MSHVVSSSIRIHDLECLKRALKKFPNLRFQEGQKTFTWFGEWVGDYDKADAAYKNGIAPEDYGKCDHALRLDGNIYEIGIVKRKDGDGYSLVWDFYADGRNISDYIGKGAEKLLVEYSTEFCRMHAEAEGMMFNQTEDSEYVMIEMTPTV